LKNILLSKSPLTPLYQRGGNSSLLQREARRDLIFDVYTIADWLVNHRDNVKKYYLKDNLYSNRTFLKNGFIKGSKVNILRISVLWYNNLLYKSALQFPYEEAIK